MRVLVGRRGAVGTAKRGQVLFSQGLAAAVATSRASSGPRIHEGLGRGLRSSTWRPRIGRLWCAIDLASFGCGVSSHWVELRNLTPQQPSQLFQCRSLALPANTIKHLVVRDICRVHGPSGPPVLLAGDAGKIGMHERLLDTNALQGIEQAHLLKQVHAVGAARSAAKGREALPSLGGGATGIALLEEWHRLTRHPACVSF